MGAPSAPLSGKPSVFPSLCRVRACVVLGAPQSSTRFRGSVRFSRYAFLATFPLKCQHTGNAGRRRAAPWPFPEQLMDWAVALPRHTTARRPSSAIRLAPRRFRYIFQRRRPAGVPNEPSLRLKRRRAALCGGSSLQVSTPPAPKLPKSAGSLSLAPSAPGPVSQRGRRLASAAYK